MTDDAPAKPSSPPAEPTFRLNASVGVIPGVGDARRKALRRIGIGTLSDLLRHLPMRYEQVTAESTIDMLTIGAIGTAKGTVVSTRVVQGGRGKSRFQATLEDHSGRLNLTWFNAGYLQSRIRPGLMLRVEGKVGAFSGYPQMANAKWQVIGSEDEEESPQRDYLRPIYPATENLPSARIEAMVERVLPELLPQLVDPLPEELVKLRAMPALAEAFRMMHQPAHEEEPLIARRRLAFNELLLLQLGIALKRHHVRTHMVASALPVTEAIDRHIRDRFPFPLTKAQTRVVGELAEDLQQTKPMNRLVQGDVGSGKTVVALYALLLAVAERKQGALMAPTELLAEQHFASITRMLKGSNVHIALLTGGRSAARQELTEAIERGDIDIVIGTQALLTESVRFNELAVVVVDEQHRFGVLQRAAFRERNTAATQDAQGRQHSPHYLVMTATPIPRTLSLTIFGDLDVSTIDELPPGRTPITTRVVTGAQSDEVYTYLQTRLQRGEQAYVVLPAIDSNEGDDSNGLKNVQDHVKMLEQRLGDEHRVAAVHGRLSSEDRDAVMERFRSGEVKVLVATTVIEVGIDVPNATVMIVEHAERFGLSQLHQLRGRVGRGSDGRRSLCVFIADPTTDDAIARMQAIAGTNDGFKIAESDLEIRGMGDFFGTRQHGMPPLRVASIPADMDLLQLAKRDAEVVVREDAALTSPRWAAIRKLLLRQYGDALGLIDVG